MTTRSLGSEHSPQLRFVTASGLATPNANKTPILFESLERRIGIVLKLHKFRKFRWNPIAKPQDLR